MVWDRLPKNKYEPIRFSWLRYIHLSDLAKHHRITTVDRIKHPQSNLTPRSTLDLYYQNDQFDNRRNKS